MSRPAALAPLALALPVGLLAIVASGCGPFSYVAQVGSAAAPAIADARQLGADARAPYEITAADAYLHQARELAGHSRYQSAVEFGHKAELSARRAQQIAQRKADARALSGDPADSSPPPSGAKAPMDDDVPSSAPPPSAGSPPR